MSSLFDDLDLFAQQATDEVMGEEARIEPMVMGDYTGFSADPGRSVVLISAVDFTADSRSPLKGTVRGDENITGTTFEDYEATVWISSDEAKSIGYQLRPNDRIVFHPGEANETTYEVLRSEPDTGGNLVVHVAVLTKPH